jgi:hypothetical protein
VRCWSYRVSEHDLLSESVMSGPAQLLPYFSAADEACLADAGTARIRAVGSAAEFYSLFLASNSEFDTAVHNGLGDKYVGKRNWHCENMLFENTALILSALCAVVCTAGS